jgi:methylation protein EvaC
MRYVIAHQGAHLVSEAVAALYEREEQLGLTRPETFEQLRRDVERSRDDLMALIGRVREQGERIVGYGATSKSTTVINYCGITPDHVEFISDTTPIKQGKTTPGAHIPVRPYEAFTRDYPPYALLFAWNHAAEIRAKEAPFREAGGKWIVYVPDVQVVE